MNLPDALSPGEYAVYALIDPNDGLVYYIGQTRNPKQRLSTHLTERFLRRAKAEWLRGLIEKGQQPVMQILETITGEGVALAREREWIHRFIQQGMPLVNGETQREALQYRRSTQAITPLWQETAVFCGCPVTRVCLPNGHMALALNSLTDTLGVTCHGQFQRIQRDPFLSDYLFYVRLKTIGGPQIVWALAEEVIPFWASGIQPQKVPSERQALLHSLQHKAANILYQHPFQVG